MATPAEIQAQLNAACGIDAGTSESNGIKIIQSSSIDATYDEHYVFGNHPSRAGKGMWVKTISANTAAQQSADIFSTLLQSGNFDATLCPYS